MVIRGYSNKRIMKKEYIKPEIVEVTLSLESVLATSFTIPSEGMDGNDTPGTDDDFNTSKRNENEWDTYWE